MHTTHNYFVGRNHGKNQPDRVIGTVSMVRIDLLGTVYRLDECVEAWNSTLPLYWPKYSELSCLAGLVIQPCIWAEY